MFRRTSQAPSYLPATRVSKTKRRQRKKSNRLPKKKRGFDERRNAANKIELDPEAVEKARKLVRQAKKRQKKKKKKLADISESE